MHIHCRYLILKDFSIIDFFFLGKFHRRKSHNAKKLCIFFISLITIKHSRNIRYKWIIGNTKGFWTPFPSLLPRSLLCSPFFIRVQKFSANFRIHWKLDKHILHSFYLLNVCGIWSGITDTWNTCKMLMRTKLTNWRYLLIIDRW